jgi:hypothetical protein
MKGMPDLYYAEGIGDSPKWVGSVLYIKGEDLEGRQRYLREDAEPLPSEAFDTAPRPPNRRRPVLLAVAVLVGAFAVGSFTAVNLFPAQANVTPAAVAGAPAWSGPLGRLDDHASIAGAVAPAWSGPLGR